MRRAVAALALVVLAVPLAAPPAAAGDCAAMLSISDAGFIPETETVSMPAIGGPTFCWHNGGSLQHTSTSNEGFFDTGTLMPTASGSDTLPGSGRFGYRCEIHGSMNGVAKVRPQADDTSVTVGTDVLLTIGNGNTKGYDWDVQRKIGDGRWVTIRSEVGSAVTVRPSRAGTFWYRARTRDTFTAEISGWSPARKVVVAA